MHNSDTNFNWSCPIDENRPGSCQLLYFSVTSICWFTLYFFLFSKIGKYRLFKNLDMNAVFFYKCQKFSLCMSLLPVFSWFVCLFCNEAFTFLSYWLFCIFLTIFFVLIINIAFNFLKYYTVIWICTSLTSVT